MMNNVEFALISYPQGEPQPKNFDVRACEYPKINNNEFIVELEAFSVDPYLRNRMHPDDLPLNKAIESRGVGTVVESKHPDYKIGDTVAGYLLLQKYAVSNGDRLRKLNKDKDIQVTAELGVLGIPGLTAYFGLLHAGGFKKGDVVVVSAAAGAVGSLAGQLARIHGAKKVIGTAGGQPKCDHVVKKFKFDACLDYKKYKTAEEMKKAIQEVAPEGVDLYFENTGGHVTQAVFDVMNLFGRVAVCGQISEYNGMPTPIPNLLFRVLYKRINIRGFIVHDYAKQYNEFYKEVPPLIKSGEILFDEAIYKGFEKGPEAFIGLFHGSNLGKVIVTV